MVCEVTEYDADILKPMIGLAVESGHEGRGGRHVGTLFTLERANTQALDRRARYNRDAQTRAAIAGHKKAEKDDNPKIIEETRQEWLTVVEIFREKRQYMRSLKCPPTFARFLQGR